MHGPMSTRARGLLLASLVLSVLAVGVGSAFAAIPNPGDGKYYACRVKATGAVRLINYPKVSTCPKGQKLIDWSRTGPRGQAGAEGPAGAQGLQGAQGVPGTAGITKINITAAVKNFDVPANTVKGDAATCPAGRAVAGGYTQVNIDVLFTESIPSGNGWAVTAHNTGGVPRSVTVYAVCMSTDPSTVIATASKSKVAKKRGK